MDLMISTRGGPDQPWSKALRFPMPINTSDTESKPELSRDGRTIYFGSKRLGGEGLRDIWYITRELPVGND